jgi:hypothetical protein
MSRFWLITGLGFTLMMIGCAAANFAVFRMLEDVNSQRPTEKYISEIGWHFLKTRRVWMLHRSLVPESRVRKSLVTACIAMAFGFVIVGVGLLSSHAANAR